MLRAAARGCVLRPAGAAALLTRRTPVALAVRTKATSAEEGPLIFRDKGPTSLIFDDKHVFPDQVLEEEKLPGNAGTHMGSVAGLPLKYEKDLWESANGENELLAERAEYFWDDGTAEPEWFVDRGSSGGFAGGRPWAQSTASAAAQLAGVFLGIAVFIGGPAYIIGDSLKPAAPRWAYGLPYEREQRLAMMGIDGYQGSAANAGLNPQTMPDAEEEEE